MRRSHTLSSALAVLLVASLALPGCGGGPATAKVPEWKPENETKCKVTKSQSRPLIVEWPSNDRVALESTMKDGIAMVRANGCEVEVLHRCKASVTRYGYRGTTKEADSVSIRNEDDLYANLPLGAASLTGKLQSSGSLNVNMAVVGRYVSDGSDVSVTDLQGDDCNRATHYISAVSVGAFSFFAGGSTEVGAGVDSKVGAGIGARTASAREELKSGGNVASCDRSSRKDSEPPEGCGALLRIEIVPLSEGRRPAVHTCPTGKTWNGSRCAEDERVGATPTATSPTATSRPTPTATSRPPTTPTPNPTPGAPPHPLSPLYSAAGYSVLFGAILLSTGGIGALQQKKKLEDNPGWCSGNVCTQEGTSARKAGRVFAITADVGVGLLALGGVFFWLAPSRSKTSVGLSPDGVRLAGEFLAMRLATLSLALLALGLTHCEQIIGANFSAPDQTVEADPSTGGVNPKGAKYPDADAFCQAFAGALCQQTVQDACWPSGGCAADTTTACLQKMGQNKGYLNDGNAEQCISYTKSFATRGGDSGKDTTRLSSCARAFAAYAGEGEPCTAEADCTKNDPYDTLHCIVSDDKTYRCKKPDSSEKSSGDSCRNNRCNSATYCDATAATPLCVDRIKTGPCTTFKEVCASGSACIDGACKPTSPPQVTCTGNEAVCGATSTCEQEDPECTSSCYKTCVLTCTHDVDCGSDFCIQGKCRDSIALKVTPNEGCQALVAEPLLGAF